MKCNRTDLSDKLILYVEGSLPDNEYAELSEHVSSCTLCRKELEDITEVLALLDVSAKHIKENWKHPSSDEITALALKADEMEEEKRKTFGAHITRCPMCREEFLMLRESPTTAEEAEPEEIPEMPAAVADAYKKAFPAEKSRYREITMKDMPTGNFWERLFKSLFPQVKKAYVAMATVTLMIVVSGLIVGTSFINNDRSPSTDNVAESKYVRYYTGNMTPEEAESFARYLRENAIRVRNDNGIIYVAPDDEDKVANVERRFLSRRTPRPGHNVAINTYTPSYPATYTPPTFTPEETKTPGIESPKPPLITTEPDYPTASPDSADKSPSIDVSPEPVKTAKPPVVVASSAGLVPVSIGMGMDVFSEEPVDDDGIIASVTSDYNNVERHFAETLSTDSIYTEGEASTAIPDPVPGSAGAVSPPPVVFPGAVKGSSASTVKDKPPVIIMNSSAMKTGSPLKERKEAAESYQKDFQNRVHRVIEKHPGILDDVEVEVSVTVSAKKNNRGKYPVKSVEVSVNYSKAPSRDEIHKIEDQIKKSLDWQRFWEGGVYFLQKF